MANPSYALTKHLKSVGFDAAIAAVTESLKAEGFGVLTEIDIQKTFKAKLDVDHRRYVILGACNPTLAHRALSADELVGLLLPCNVIVAEEDEGSMVAIVNPREMFKVVENVDLGPIVDEVDAKLHRVIDSL